MGRRVFRVALVCVGLIALAAVCATYEHRALAVVLAICAGSLALAYNRLVARPAWIPRDAVLFLRVTGRLHEETRRTPLDQILGRGFPSLSHLRYALEAARTDPRLRAVVVEVAGFENGFATAEELHDLLRKVREAGKPVIAVLQGDLASARDYIVASGAGQIVINPETMLAMLGVAASSVFLKRALERVRIHIQTIQWKEYKGTGEMFSRERMSEQLRESLDAILSDWREVLVGRIASARGIERERASHLAAAGFLGAAAACSAGLANREGYLQDIRTELEPDPKHPRFVGLGRYVRHAVHEREHGRRARIALVCGVGPVVAGRGPSAGEFISGQTTGAQIERAARDESVRAIVFRVNSPGGSASGSDMVWRAVRGAQAKGKPVVVSMGDVAGSGGYYVAAGADAIVAEPSTVTGSIGVIYAKPDLSGLLGELGIGVDVVKTDPASDALSIARAMTEDELSQLNEAIGRLYGNFTAKVAEGRRLSPEATEQVARGRVWSGMAARQNGLVDDVGGLARAIEIAREKAGIDPNEPHALVSFSQARFIAALRLSLADDGTFGAGLGLAADALGVPTRWMPALMTLVLRGGVMMLAPLFDLL